MLGAAGSTLWPWLGRHEVAAPRFIRTLMHQLYWMLFMGVPLVGMVHVAIGSFLSLQAYYGSTFVDGTGAVVGVGLLRNLGSLMTGLTFAGIMANRMIPELQILMRNMRERAANTSGNGTREIDRRTHGNDVPAEIELPIRPGRVAAPRVVAAAIACVLLSQWGVAVGTLVGWRASLSIMGLSTETFFMMMLKMMWFRDVVGLVVKGVAFGAIPAAICCYEGFGRGAPDDAPAQSAANSMHHDHALPPPWSAPAFRATCLSFVTILVMNSSWFMLVYHAVPFYGPTLLSPQGP
jgi:phospholipid/cholesterol/gamma-HCH transport system permease protein